MILSSAEIKSWDDAQDAACEAEEGWMQVERLSNLKGAAPTAWETGFIARMKGWPKDGHFLIGTNSYNRFQKGWKKAEEQFRQD